ncbi:MAG: ABC transporter substrate-binding protein [Spirochaetaceae bacterium]|jgi:NitT/TauT family transport system substrate-binding protein|nr:ABC transporter substrate-binding protein [Spirochaetaceae bacterium]
MKKICFILALAGLVLPTVWAKGKPQATAAQEDFVLTIGLPVEGGLCEAPFYIAVEKGFYEAEGLKYREFKTEPGTTMTHLTNGTVDITNNLLATMIQPLANGLDVKIPLALHTGCIKVIVPTDSPITTPADLRGKKIGVPSMNASQRVIPARVLAALGIKVDGDGAEVEWLIYPSAELPLALERGQVDAIGIGDPGASIIENQGKARAIINSATDASLKDELCCVTPVRSQTLADHPEAVAKFLRAIQKASKWVHENPDETARIITEKRYVAGDAAVNAQVLKTYSYRASVSLAKTALERNARDLQAIGLVDKSVDVNALVNNTFVPVPNVPDAAF